MLIVIVIGFSTLQNNDVKNDQEVSTDTNLDENIIDETVSNPTGRNLTVELSESLGIKTP